MNKTLKKKRVYLSEIKEIKTIEDTYYSGDKLVCDCGSCNTFFIIFKDENKKPICMSCYEEEHNISFKRMDDFTYP